MKYNSIQVTTLYIKRFSRLLEIPVKHSINTKNTRYFSEQSALRTGNIVKIEKRKLVLHFDVRNTVVVGDSNTNVEQALSSFFTRVTWGKNTPKGWQWVSNKPSLKPPLRGSITYYKHLEKHLVQSRKDRVVFRKATSGFIYQPFAECINQYFQKHLRLLRWPHSKANPKLTITGHAGKLYHYVIPAFFRLLEFLQEKNRDFAVIMRTYGTGAPNVLAAIEYTTEGNHPSYPKSIPLHVHLEPGRINRSSGGIVFELPSGQRYNKESEIATMLNSLAGVWGFVDDFDYWQSQNYHHT